MRRVVVPVACAAVVATGLLLPASAGAQSVGPMAAAQKVNPEKAKRSPKKDLGYYLGYPMPTYRWHGCTMTSTRRAPTPTGGEPDPISEGTMPKPRKGTKQGKVRFVVVPSAAAHGWTMRWEVKKPSKFKICGVQVSGGFARPGVSERYVAQAGYTSTARKGSTVAAGDETFTLKVPRNSASSFPVPAEYEGKTLDTKIIYAVTVFLRKKK